MTECCCIESCDLEGTMLRDGECAARKSHLCEECRGPIMPGERYHYYVGTCDGSVTTARHCLPCAGIARDFFRCGIAFGEMRQDFYDCMGFDYLGEWKEAAGEW